MKNNGGLRLVKNQEVINNINLYYNEIANLKEQEHFMNDYLILINKERGNIFNYNANKRFVDSVNRRRQEVLPQTEIDLSNGVVTQNPGY